METQKKQYLFYAGQNSQGNYSDRFQEHKLHHIYFDSFSTEQGSDIRNFRVAYRVFGTPNEKRDNIILVFHALTGDCNCSGYTDADGYKPGWWEPLFSAGKSFDLSKYCIICPNHPGGCYGSIGPTDQLVGTSSPIGPDFPLLTVRDVARGHQLLLQKLNIHQLHCVIGGSFGGMVVSEFIINFPNIAQNAVMIAAPVAHSAQALAMNHIQRKCIENDSNYKGGRYYHGPLPNKGLSLARQIGMITYRNPAEFDSRFGRSPQKINTEKETYFKIQSYLDHQGQKLLNRFDANSYIKLTYTMDEHDISQGSGDFNKAIRKIKSNLLLIAIDSDMLYPPPEMQSIKKFCLKNGVKAKYASIRSINGHDGFLIEHDQLNEIISQFFTKLSNQKAS